MAKNRQEFGISALIGGQGTPQNENTEITQEKRPKATKKNNPKQEVEQTDKMEDAKQITFFAPKKMWRELSVLSTYTERSQRDLMNEALELLLKKYKDVE